jgi:hypothetical protein
MTIFTWVTNRASILLRKAIFPRAEEEELAVLKNIKPLYVIMPLLSDHPTSFATQVVMFTVSTVIPSPSPQTILAIL